jgi:hypothetical protein
VQIVKSDKKLAMLWWSLLALLTFGQPAGFGAEDQQKQPQPVPRSVTRLEAAGLHNVFALTTNVFAGSSPEGEEGFLALKKLGVKTIVTVDGAKPDVETARQHGMRYVHLPHGYDGISANVQWQLVKVGESLPGPIYVHCHHGRHRGPAAAAVICMGNNGWTPAQAEAWLAAAGTATNYSGLYDAVRGFRKPTKEQLQAIDSSFTETAKLSGLVDHMVEVDRRWDHLKTIRAAAYEAPKEHPDLSPANEAVILWEQFREAQRLPDAAKHGAEFINRLKDAEAQAKEAERLFRLFAAKPKPDIRARLDQTFDAMARTCVSCHKAHRDSLGSKRSEVSLK